MIFQQISNNNQGGNGNTMANNFLFFDGESLWRTDIYIIIAKEPSMRLWQSCLTNQTKCFSIRNFSDLLSGYKYAYGSSFITFQTLGIFGRKLMCHKYNDPSHNSNVDDDD